MASRGLRLKGDPVAVIVVVLGSELRSQLNPTQSHRGGRLLHHRPGHDPSARVKQTEAPCHSDGCGIKAKK